MPAATTSRPILVTGGAGFIGTNFLAHVLSAAPERPVVVLDAFTYAGSRLNLEPLIEEYPQLELVQGEIGDRSHVAAVIAERGVTDVVHVAAQSHVDRSFHNPQPFVDTNVLGTLTVLEAAHDVWRGRDDVRLLYVSSNEVYGDLPENAPPFRESDPARPNNPYAATKVAAEAFVHAWRQSFGVPTLICRSANNYGPRQHPEKFIPRMITRAIAGESLPIYGDGRQVREWLHVADHADALLRVLDQAPPGAVYNIAGTDHRTNLSLAKSICDFIDAHAGDPAGTRRELIQFVADRPAHDRRFALDGRKIARDLGWRPSRLLATHLKAVIGWYIENPDWISAVTAAGVEPSTSS